MTDSSKNMRKGSISFFKFKYPLSRTVTCLLPYHQNAKDFKLILKYFVVGH